MEATPTDAVASGNRKTPKIVPLHAAVAEHVRRDSETRMRPTRLELVGEDGQLLDGPAVKAVLAEMKATPEYEDLDYVETPDGSLHAYSTRFMNDKLAGACALHSLGDNAATIAATVRERSELYPAPTPVEMFSNEPWFLTPEEITAAVTILESGGGYGDIHRTTASNGAVYLYSNRFLTEAGAAAKAEWEAVGVWLNP